MAYATPPTFVSGNTLTAAQLNVLSDDITYLKSQTDALAFVGVSLYRPPSQSLTDDTWTNVTWTVNNVETGGDWWSSGANITVPASAVPSGYTSVVLEVTMQARFAANGTGGRSILVALDGTTVEQGFYTSAMAADDTAIMTTVWAVASAGQVITGQVWQNSGGNLNLYTSMIHIKRVGAL